MPSSVYVISAQRQGIGQYPLGRNKAAVGQATFARWLEVDVWSHDAKRPR